MQPSRTKQQSNKKFRYIIFALAAAVLAAALFFARQRRGDSKPDEEHTDPYSEISVLPIADVSAFCVGEDGTLYVCQNGENAIRAYTADGKCTAVYPVEADLVSDKEELADSEGLSWKEVEKKPDNIRPMSDTEKTPDKSITSDNPDNLNVSDMPNIPDTAIPSNSQAQTGSTAENDELPAASGLYALSSLCYSDGKIYCYRSGTDSYLRLDPVSGNTEIIWKNEEVQAYEIAVSGDTAAILYRSGEEDDCDRSIGEGRLENFWCTGGRLGLLNLRTREWKALDYHYLVTVTAMGSRGFLLEGFDRENGFYLAKLDTEGVLGERKAAGFRENFYLAWDEERAMFHGTGAFEWEGKCSSGTLEQPEKAYRYWNNGVMTANGGVRYAAGYLYLLSSSAEPSEGGKITRLKPSLFFREAEPLKVYLCSPSSEPDWQGYPVETKMLRYEDLAIKLLAGDSDFDLVITDSGMSAAWNIKRVKAYYPLQAALAEPLSVCFDGVRQLVADGDAVWALPLSMNLQALVYSEENLKKEKAADAAMETMPGLVGAADLLNDAGWSGWYAADFRSIQIYLLQDYLAGRAGTGRITFDTPEFSALLDAAKEYVGRKSLMSGLTFQDSRERYQEIYDRTIREGGSSAAADEAVREACVQDVFFDLITWQTSEEYDQFIGREQFAVLPVPGMDARDREYAAWVDLLIVNPASARREQALKLAESIAEAQIADPENYLSADRSLYPDDSFSEALYQACSRAVVRESLPQEIYEAIFTKIWNGEVGREEGVKELERVVNAYLLE